MKKCVLFLSCFLLLALTGSSFAQQPAPPAPPATPEVKNDGQAKEVIAKIGERTVTVGQIEEEFSKIPPQFISHFNDPQRKEQYVQNMIDRIVFSKEAREKGFLDKPDLKEKVDSYVERLLYADYLKTVTEGVSVSNEEVNAYYEANKTQFATPERVKARHILVKTEEEAIKVKDEIDKGGNWDELATKYSTDKSNASRGGDLGYFSRGRMVKEFEDAIFAMNVGEIRGPIKTQFGFHIVKLEDKKPAENQPLDQVENAVRNKVLTDKRQAKLEEVRKELFTKYHVEFDTSKVKDIRVGSGNAEMMGNQPGAMPVRMEPPRDTKKPEPAPEKK